MAGHSLGAVTLQDTYSTVTSLGSPTDLGGSVFGYEVDVATAGFSAAGHDKMVLSYSSWDDVTFDASVTSVTYNGVPLTQAIQDEDNDLRIVTGIFYLDNVVNDGVLRIELAAGGTAESAFGLYALDGLAAGVADTGTGRLTTELTTTLPVTISTSQGFFVQEAARNNQTLDGSADGFTDLYDISVNAYRALQQYQVTSAAGDYVAPINNTGENFRRAVAAGFEAVPEPSSAALIGLCGLALILRRRRS